MAVSRKCKGCGQGFIAQYSGTLYCDACGMESRARKARNRQAAKRTLVCDCGNPKPRDYIHCVDCRRAKLEAQMRDQSRRSTWERAKFPARLPVAPLSVKLMRFVELHAEYNEHDVRMIEPILKRLGIDSRRYFEWREGRSLRITFRLADRVLTAAGWDWEDVWSRETCPELFDALDAIEALGEAEADGFCEVCSEWVATINGCCPWHDRPIPASASEPFEGPDGSLSEMAA